MSRYQKFLPWGNSNVSKTSPTFFSTNAVARGAQRFCILDTPHLNRKKLSTNSSWDFEHVFETMDDYWVGPDENFCPESTRTRWRCNHFSKKWSKSKSDTTLSIKKPFVTPNFCGQNFSTMHHFCVWIFLSPKIDE